MELQCVNDTMSHGDSLVTFGSCYLIHNYETLKILTSRRPLRRRQSIFMKKKKKSDTTYFDIK